MNRMLRVEGRKLIRRKDVYILTSILLFLSFFVNYQLSLENPALRIERTDGIATSIPLPELTQLLINVLSQTGIFTVMLAVIIWNIIGRELDQKIIYHYFVNSKNRLHVYGAKILFTVKIIIVLFGVFVGSFLLFSYLFHSDRVQITYSGEAWQELGKIFLLTIFMFIIYTLCAFLFSLFFGSMGTLMGTVGLWLVFTLLKFFEEADRFNPLVFNNIYSLESFPESLLLNFLYVALLAGAFVILALKRDLK